MKISVTNAQALIHTLQAGIDSAMAKGEHEFEFIAAVQADDDAARVELARAIKQAQAAKADREAAEKPATETQTASADDIGSLDQIVHQSSLT